MSEELFDKIDTRLDRLEHGQEALRADVTGLRTDVDGLRTDVNDLRTGQDSLIAGQKSLVAGYDRLSGEISDLRRHMGVLHEEVLDRIKALVYDPEPIRREFRAADNGLREELTRRIEPLEAAMRHKRRGH